MISDGSFELNQTILAALAGEPSGLSFEAIAARTVGHDPRKLNWAAIELQTAGLIETDGAGRFYITPAGTATAGRRFGERQGGREAVISAAAGRADVELERSLIARVHALPPTGFELLIVDLLTAMGYGTGRADLSRRLGRSGDGGIDGVIDLDELGLDAIYIQAKRYRPSDTVPVGAVRDFAGSLDAVRASRGVFFTTAQFTPAAHEFVAKASRRIKLADGAMLTRLMMRYGLGVREHATYVIRNLDENYFLGLAGTGLRRAEISSASIQPRR